MRRKMIITLVFPVWLEFLIIILDIFLFINTAFFIALIIFISFM